jgi:HAMP domain-containing protein
MKIATHNLLLIVPIFLLLALVTSGLLFFSERREVRWGLENEAQGLALTIAEFTDAAALQASGAEAKALRAPLDRVLGFGRALRITLSRVDGETISRLVDLGATAGAPPGIDPRDLKRLALDEVVVREAAGDRLVAHAPIRDGSGAMRAVASVETSLQPAAAHRAAVLRRTGMMVLVLTVVGGLVSMLISAMITRDIGRLTRTAEAFAGGDYDARLSRGLIEEVSVVGSTLGIMGSVLKDAMRRATREMLQFDRVSTDAALAASYADRFAQPLASELGGMRIAIDRLGGPAHGDFWFVRQDGRLYRACLGRVEGAASFDAVLSGSAAAALMEEAFARGEDAPAAVATASTIIPLHCCVVVEWQQGSQPAIEVHRAQASTLTRAGLRLTAAETVALTTLDQESDRRVTHYAAAHAFDTPVRCLEELHRFFGGSTDGGVLVLQVRS